MPGRTMTTTDRETIRGWAENRDARPAHVLGTGDDEDVGVLRLDFPEDESDPRLEEISWDQFFEKFDREGLALRYQETTKSGDLSNFNRFVHREETGVTEAVDEDVSVVAVGSRPTETGPETELTVGLVVAEIHEDALGFDRWNKNDEYLVFRNDGEESLDLSEWTVRNSAGDSYRFPDEYLLDPDESVTLHTGSGDVTHQHLYWGAERPRWKNSGDTVTVADADGQTVLRESY
jgi:hypothetical protein